MSGRTVRNDEKLFASCRVQKLHALHDLQLAREHANRDPGAKFEIREGAAPGSSIRWIVCQQARNIDPLSAWNVDPVFLS